MTDGLKVTITGKTSSGKTTLAELIGEVLEGADLPVKIEDGNDRDYGKRPDSKEQRVRAIARREAEAGRSVRIITDSTLTEPMSSQELNQQLPRPVVGDILITRNANEEDNSSPGYWNHVAIYTRFDVVVEAQVGPAAVIQAEWPEFWNRYPEMRIMRMEMDGATREKLARAAQELVGTTYSRFASLHRAFRRGSRRRGENCVSVVRRAFMRSTGTDPRWRKPDDVAKDTRLQLIVSKSAAGSDQP